MTLLSTLRTELVAPLGELGINTYTHLPGRMALPGAAVMAGSPYIEQGDTFGSKTVRFSVVLAIPTGTNQAETEALDDLIEAAQAALEADGWLVESVAQPFSMSFNNTEGLVTQITVTTPVTFI